MGCSMKFLLAIMISIISIGCASNYKSIKFSILDKDNEQAWSRANVYVAQYFNSGKQSWASNYVLRYFYNYTDVISIWREKTNNGWEYQISFMGPDPESSVNQIKSYITTGNMFTHTIKEEKSIIKDSKSDVVGPIPDVQPMKQYKRTNTRSD